MNALISLLLKSLKGTDWALLTSFVSPSFFDVVPSLAIAKVIGRLTREYASPDNFEKKLLEVRNAISGKLNDKLPDRRSQGQMVLELYFWQVSHLPYALLDLRTSAFLFKKNQWEWNPKPLYFEWTAEFITAVRDLYAGFYLNDKGRYQGALKALNLSHADAIFQKHFGIEDQTRVHFSLAEFQKSFQAIFDSCKANKTRLHPDFFALGAFLLCLYEHLEDINEPLNVRAAFETAFKEK